MWDQSKSQDLKGLSLLVIGLLSVFLWRRYRQSQTCTTIPCCGTVCCPGVGKCTGCYSCRRIYTPHDSSPRKTSLSLKPFAADSCAKEKTVKIKCREDPCDGSGPLDNLLCLKNLAQRSVRFYLGESPEGQGGGSCVSPCSPCSPTASCSTSLTRCCPRSLSPCRTRSPTVCCSTSLISCCPKYPSPRCTRSRSRCSSTSLTSCCPKYPSPCCTKRAPTCCTKYPIRCRPTCPPTCCKPCSPTCSPICSPVTQPTRSMKDIIREVYSYLGFSTSAPKKSCLKKTDCFKKSVSCCKCGEICSKRDSCKVVYPCRKPSKFKTDESSFEVTLKNGVMSKPNKVIQ